MLRPALICIKQTFKLTSSHELPEIYPSNYWFALSVAVGEWRFRHASEMHENNSFFTQ